MTQILLTMIGFYLDWKLGLAMAALVVIEFIVAKEIYERKEKAIENFLTKMQYEQDNETKDH